MTRLCSSLAFSVSRAASAPSMSSGRIRCLRMARFSSSRRSFDFLPFSSAYTRSSTSTSVFTATRPTIVQVQYYNHSAKVMYAHSIQNDNSDVKRLFISQHFYHFKLILSAYAVLKVWRHSTFNPGFGLLQRLQIPYF